MKKIAVLSAICVASLALSTQAAKADGISAYAGYSASMTVNPYPNNENNGQYNVGLTNLTFNAYGQTFNAFGFCDDFNHEITTPSTYTVTAEAITTDTMKQEAYYGLMFGSAPSGNTALDSEIQELIWNYTAPASKQFALTSDMQTLQATMLANYKNTDYSNSIYLDAGDGGQSFMLTQPAAIAPTPEPSSLVTLATGMIGMAGILRRKSFKKAA